MIECGTWNSFVELFQMFYRIENKIAALHLSSERSWPRAIENRPSILMTAIDWTAWFMVKHYFPISTRKFVYVYVLEVHGYNSI